MPISTLLRHGRSAFTLIEVALSLGIIAIAVLSILLIFPVGIKAQQLARYQLLAASKMEDMLDAFNTTTNSSAALDVEAFNAWDSPAGRRATAWNFENRLASYGFGLAPIPADIARRLDSDDNEIQRILADGGYIYYAQPMINTGIGEDALKPAPPNESQKLIFAVAGYPQNNALDMLPQRELPYHIPWPSPPHHGRHRTDFLPPTYVDGLAISDPGFAGRFNYPSPVIQEYCWETTNDPDMEKVFCWREGGLNYGFMPYAYGMSIQAAPPLYPTPPYPTIVNGDFPSADRAARYFQAAVWYCDKKGLPATFYNPSGTQLTTPSDPLSGAGDFEPLTPHEDRWKQVQAMRFLAHAGASLLKWPHVTPAQTPALPISVTPVSLDGLASPIVPFTVTEQHVRYYHERAMNLIMKFAAEDPYDWNVPRPAQRAIFTDYPLLEYDLFSPVLSGTIHGSGGVLASQWKPIPAAVLNDPGLTASPTWPWDPTDPKMARVEMDSGQINSYSYPASTEAKANDSTFWGDYRHFTVTAPFKAEERCRQVVCWAVDWQSYEDAETAPSAPVDASKYPFAAPRVGQNFNQRMTELGFIGSEIRSFRNPEMVMLFTGDMSGRSTGSTLADGDLVLIKDVNSGGAPDQGSGISNKSVFSGLYGADRNFNRVLDRGPVPKSVRLRATLVSRFNFYDPRVTAVIR
jgi:type II secretory pathway pseudopilin PulG